MKVSKQKFGMLSDGTKVNLYTVKNDNMSFSCTDYGCTLTSIVLNNKDGSKTDVLLGFSTLDGYLNTRYCFGAVVGRFANRIGKASFVVNGKKYTLDKNDGPNTLHGGSIGYDKYMWNAKEVKGKNYAGIKFTRISPDGEQGFPGNLKLEVSYLLDKENNLTCHYTAITDQATPVNITNHAYFNLAGQGLIDDHLLQMNSNYVLDIDSKLIPNGKFNDITGTEFDFTKEKAMGKDIAALGPGYDHCYVTEKYNPDDRQCGLPLDDSDLVAFANVKEPVTGHEMAVFTNMEGCQFYTGNWIEGLTGKNGVPMKRHGAFCLETQCFPDTPNKTEFPTCVLEPGQKMKCKTVYSFKI